MKSKHNILFLLILLFFGCQKENNPTKEKAETIEVMDFQYIWIDNSLYLIPIATEYELEKK